MAAISIALCGVKCIRWTNNKSRWDLQAKNLIASQFGRARLPQVCGGGLAQTGLQRYVGTFFFLSANFPFWFTGRVPEPIPSSYGSMVGYRRVSGPSEHCGRLGSCSRVPLVLWLSPITSTPSNFCPKWGLNQKPSVSQPNLPNPPGLTYHSPEAWVQSELRFVPKLSSTGHICFIIAEREPSLNSDKLEAKVAPARWSHSKLPVTWPGP